MRSFFISLLSGCRGISFANDRQLQIAVFVENQFPDAWENLFHGLEVQSLTGYLWSFTVLERDLIEARGVAGSLIDLLLLVGFRLFAHLLRLATGFRNQVIGIAFGVAHAAGGIGAGAGHVAER